MLPCPVSSISTVEARLFKFLRGNDHEWGELNAIQMVDTGWHLERPPNSLKFGAKQFVRINTPKLIWSKGKDCETTTEHSGRKITHFHAD
jgi:hypothetical protein